MALASFVEGTHQLQTLGLPEAVSERRLTSVVGS